MKTPEEIQNWLIPLYQQITQTLMDRMKELNANPTYERFKGDNSVLKNLSLEDEDITHFYSFFDWLNIEWKVDAISGNIKFVTYKQLAHNWDNEFGANDWAPDMKGFRPLDMFLESAGCVGFFIDRQDKKGLYLYKFDGETTPINLNFEGYLILLGISKGFNWWQNALIEINTNSPQPNVDSFKENMPQIFPDFNWREFVKLYEHLRTDK